MPRKRVGGKPRIENWEKFRTVLMFRHDYFGELGDYEPTEADLRAAWRELGPSILEEFTRDRNKAGTRPYGWWVARGFDHRPNNGEQRDYLEERGLLSAEEQRLLYEKDVQYAQRYKDVTPSKTHTEWLYQCGVRPLQPVTTVH